MQQIINVYGICTEVILMEINTTGNVTHDAKILYLKKYSYVVKPYVTVYMYEYVDW
jgi:hypothetical protein